MVANLSDLSFVSFISRRGKDDIKCNLRIFVPRIHEAARHSPGVSKFTPLSMLSSFTIFVGDNINWIFYE